MGYVGVKAGNLVKINKINKGRGNWEAVYKASMTKFHKYGYNVGYKTMIKKLGVDTIMAVPGAAIGPIPDIIKNSIQGNFKIDWIENITNKRKGK